MVALTQALLMSLWTVLPLPCLSGHVPLSPVSYLFITFLQFLDKRENGFIANRESRMPDSQAGSRNWIKHGCLAFPSREAKAQRKAWNHRLSGKMSLWAVHLRKGMADSVSPQHHEVVAGLEKQELCNSGHVSQRFFFFFCLSPWISLHHYTSNSLLSATASW